MKPSYKNKNFKIQRNGIGIIDTITKRRVFRPFVFSLEESAERMNNFILNLAIKGRPSGEVLKKKKNLSVKDITASRKIRNMVDKIHLFDNDWAKTTKGFFRIGSFIYDSFKKYKKCGLFKMEYNLTMFNKKSKAYKAAREKKEKLDQRKEKYAEICDEITRNAKNAIVPSCLNNFLNSFFSKKKKRAIYNKDFSVNDFVFFLKEKKIDKNKVESSIGLFDEDEFEKSWMLNSAELKLKLKKQPKKNISEKGCCNINLKTDNLVENEIFIGDIKDEDLIDDILI